MITEIDAFERHVTGTIKVGRYKTVKTIEKISTGTLFTKILNFSVEEDILWIEEELQERLTTLENIHQTTAIHLSNKKILEALQKRTNSHQTIYLSNKYMQGWNLTDFLARKNDLYYLKAQHTKEVVWEIMTLLIAGKGFTRLIVTNENLFFELVSQDRYRPAVNYLSFVGLRFLQSEGSIDKQEYAQIAMFVDQEALNSGNLDRFQFKVRNFACLILSLLCERNPFNFIFQNVKIDNFITKQKAKELLKTVVTPKINELLSYSSLKKRIKELNLKGLQGVLQAAFNHPSDNVDWAKVRVNLLDGGQEEASEFIRLSQLFWSGQDQQTKQFLRQKGCGGVMGSELYLAVRLNVNLQNLLKSNNWQSLILQTQYNRLNRDMFYRLLKIYNLQEDNIQEQIVKHLLKIAKTIFKSHQLVEGQKIVLTTNEYEILSQYAGLK